MLNQSLGAMRIEHRDLHFQQQIQAGEVGTFSRLG